ncbi:protein-glutamate methylesterase/protein-glutamine glutaminase [Bacillus suaedaesalsae]|uniref:Protein-glutamate methylesterase/protein-glutamine glutaminase n=1 Tax=Bacillus suaedaesalsae TaxID=2810349 RepID=A0ABS2DIV4_9BACI|nr:chemotaxis response regulator protein-glutamate methylesterase [Bacillus suaedaesalsae]MBM6618425.1 chemotaxis response regulator protein-glutamate methylesterase [Bacillus suaedaesalsae]
MDRINVLVVDDSAFMRKLITNFLEEDSRFHIVGTARNGQDAVKKVLELKPDVVTLDVEMPILNGLQALKEIMKIKPVPVVMLSSTTKEGAENTILAMQYGAVDFVEKPSGAISLDLHKVKEEIKDKVYHASTVKKAKLNRMNEMKITTIPNGNDYSKINNNEFFDKKPLNLSKKVICIGTSTGGPRALQQVITRLPKDIDAPILVVQHMPAGFTKSLASRLDSLSQIEVKEAEDGEIIKKGIAYIAPGGYHFLVKRIGTSLAVSLDLSPPKNGHRPSVDLLFDSVSQLSDYAKVAVIMTGMGSDGTDGLVKLKNTGEVRSIAESEETSIVYGMPKAAVASNKVDSIVRLDEIAEQIMKMLHT